MVRRVAIDPQDGQLNYLLSLACRKLGQDRKANQALAGIQEPCDALSSPLHKLGHVYLEARWTIGNFGHGMPCPYVSGHPTDL